MQEVIAASLRRQQVERIDDVGQFAAIEEAWERLAEVERSPFLRHAWLRCWWNAFGDARRLRVYVLWDGDDLAAAFPLSIGRRRLESLAGPLAPDFRPLARDAEAGRVVVDAALADAGELVVRGLAVDAPAARTLALAAHQQGFLVRADYMQRSPLVETHGDEGTYLKGLDGSFRRHLARRRRKLEREHATSWRVGADPQDLEAELTAVLELEAAGWKGRDRGAVLCSPAMTDFYRALAPAFHAAGRLRIDRIDVDGRLAAAQICLLDFDRLWMLRTAYDESLRSYGPGLLLSFAAVKWCFATGLEAFELLGDEQKWKRHLATAAHEHAVFRLYRARPLPLARFACRQVALPLMRRYAAGGRLRRSLTRSLVAGSDQSRLRSH